MDNILQFVQNLDSAFYGAPVFKSVYATTSHSWPQRMDIGNVENRPQYRKNTIRNKANNCEANGQMRKKGCVMLFLCAKKAPDFGNTKMRVLRQKRPITAMLLSLGLRQKLEGSSKTNGTLTGGVRDKQSYYRFWYRHKVVCNCSEGRQNHSYWWPCPITASCSSFKAQLAASLTLFRYDVYNTQVVSRRLVVEN